jgi:hypothetical protein
MAHKGSLQIQNLRKMGGKEFVMLGANETVHLHRSVSVSYASTQVSAYGRADEIEQGSKQPEGKKPASNNDSWEIWERILYFLMSRTP